MVPRCHPKYGESVRLESAILKTPAGRPLADSLAAADLPRTCRPTCRPTCRIDRLTVLSYNRS